MMQDERVNRLYGLSTFKASIQTATLRLYGAVRSTAIDLVSCPVNSFDFQKPEKST